MMNTLSRCWKAALLAAALTSTALPANAQSLNFPSFRDVGGGDFHLIDLRRFLGDAYREARQLLNEQIADNFETDTAVLLQDVIDGSLGVFGFPAPASVRRGLEEELTRLPQADVTQPVPMAERDAIGRELNRSLLRSQIDTVLGEDGQQLTQEKVDAAAATVEATGQLASEAQTAISTQAVMKAMALQQAQSTALMGAIHTELLQGRQDTAAQSMALADISESLDQQLSTRQAERRGEAIIGLEQAAAARLF